MMSDGKGHMPISAKDKGRINALTMVNNIITSFDEETDKQKTDALISKFVNRNHYILYRAIC
jgi:hypothetical protein